MAEVSNTNNSSSTSISNNSKISSSSTATSGNSSLGKDAFLKLLVTQMQYQDPLSPQDNTEYVAQLATFSQLEQMQNMNSTFTNSQAFSLVGKEVIMKTTSSTGTIGYVNGTVDFVTMVNGAPYVSINSQLYEASQLDSVVSSSYSDSLKKSSTTSTTTTSNATTNTATASSTAASSTAASSTAATTTNSSTSATTDSSSSTEDTTDSESAVATSNASDTETADAGNSTDTTGETTV